MAYDSILSIFGFSSKNVHDAVKPTQNVDIDKQKQETGMDRLRTMFSLDEYGYQSKEVMMITQGSSLSLFGSFIIGGIVQSRGAYVNFIENNQATKFTDHLDAKRQLQRTMYLSFMKGGWRWGWRISLFSLSFTTLMTTVSVYRGKDALLEYLVAGGITGGIFRMNLGLKGVVAGTFLGTALGGIAGSLSLLVLKMGGVSMEDMRNFSKTLHDTRQNAINESLKEYMIKEHTDLSNKKADDAQFVNLKVDEEAK